MDALRKLFRTKDQRIITYLGGALIVGLFLMLVSNFFREVESPQERQIMSEPSYYINTPPANVSESEHHVYERALEKRLEEVLSLVDGAGKVRVMVSLAQRQETVFAVDRNINESRSQEADAQGGTRYQTSHSSQDKTLIITDRAGVDRPLVIKEVPPIIGGVMIIAEGGDKVNVRDALIRATSALLGIDINRVQVMKMANVNN